MKKNMKKTLWAVALLATATVGNAENRFYINDFEIEPGETKTVCVQLDNEVAFAGFQADILYPEGFTVTNEKLVAERIADHTLSYHLQDDGYVRYISISFSNSSFVGTSGDFLSFDITAPADAEAGSQYTISLKELHFSYTENYEVTPYVLENSQCTITIPSNEEEPTLPANCVYMEDFSIEAGITLDNSIQKSINFSSEYQITGFSAELVLPEGLYVDEYLSGSNSWYKPTTNISVTDNVVSMSVSSSRALTVYDGAIANIYFYTDETFSGIHTLEFRNVKFIDGSGIEQSLSNTTFVVTGPEAEDNEVELLLQNSYYNNMIFYCTKGVQQKVKIISIDDRFFLNTVTFNGEDVTDELVEGVYITPVLNEDATLNVSYTIPTAQDAPIQNSPIKAYGYQGNVVINGCEAGDNIAIYDVDGVLLRTQYATDATQRIAMPTDAIYIVRVANTAVKVAL